MSKKSRKIAGLSPVGISSNLRAGVKVAKTLGYRPDGK
jgi:hypothetical protein